MKRDFFFQHFYLNVKSLKSLHLKVSQSENCFSNDMLSVMNVSSPVLPHSLQMKLAVFKQHSCRAQGLASFHLICHTPPLNATVTKKRKKASAFFQETRCTLFLIKNKCSNKIITSVRVLFGAEPSVTTIVRLLWLQQEMLSGPLVQGWSG